MNPASRFCITFNTTDDTDGCYCSLETLRAGLSILCPNYPWENVLSWSDFENIRITPLPEACK